MQFLFTTVAVDQSKGMLGTFAPRREAYVHTLDEETTPSGVLARGMYSAKLKVCAINAAYLHLDAVFFIIC